MFRRAAKRVYRLMGVFIDKLKRPSLWTRCTRDRFSGCAEYSVYKRAVKELIDELQGSLWTSVRVKRESIDESKECF